MTREQNRAETLHSTAARAGRLRARLAGILGRLKPLHLAGAMSLGLAACSAPVAVDNPGEVSRSLAGPEAISAAAAAPKRSYSVAGVQIDVPRSLRVSERNRYYPGGDIVWREDPIGDRYVQVAAIMQAGVTQGGELLAGQRPVTLEVEVTRFHALTEKARYSFGGVHAIQFNLTVRDAETGEIVEPARHIKADFEALGGMAAIAAEQRGVTQKTRITAQLAHVIRQELTSPDGYQPLTNGFMGALNQL